MTKINATCSFDGCDAVSAHLGLCGGHYAQQYRGKPLTPLRKWGTIEAEWPAPRTDGRCAVGDCAVEPHARGLCRSHYSQIRNGRTVGPVRHKNNVVDGMKTCGQCGDTKPVSEFGKQLRGVQYMCLSCRRIDSRMRAYGLTRDEVLALCDVSQCESCGVDIDSATTAHHIDHCHDTGRVRGVLCHGCNTALGLTREDPKVLRALADYIEQRSRSAVTA